MFVWRRALAQKKGRGLATITPDIGAAAKDPLVPSIQGKFAIKN